MKLQLRLFLFSMMAMASVAVSAQADTVVKYMPSFNFTDGLYLSYEDFASNCPSVTEKDLYYSNGRPVQEIGMDIPIYTLTGDTLYLVDSETVWGFSEKGQVYVRHRNFYNRMVVIGSICHISHAIEHADYDYTYEPTYSNSMSVHREAIDQYLIDMSTGEKHPFNEKILSELMMNDSELHREFNAIPQKSKRRSRMYLYLRRFNDAHPIYFPINGCTDEVEIEASDSQH